MDMLIKYLLYASVNIIMFYLVYYFFLRRETFFRVSRFYLIAAILSSLLIPLISINIQVSGSEPAYLVMLDAVTITSQEVREAVTSNLSLFQIVSVVYLTGLVLFFIRFIFQLFQLLSVVWKYGISMQDGQKIVFVSKSFSPFSFFNLIFISPSDYQSKQAGHIMAHEKAHIRQLHSFDLIILELLTILLWFNPVIWLYRNSLKEVHEYLADEGVLGSGHDYNRYTNILLNLTLNVQLNDLTNNFSKSLLKRRIMMMTKNRSPRTATLKFLLAFPGMFIIALLFTFSINNQAIGQEENKEIPPPPPKETKDLKSSVSGEEEQVFKVVETMPQFTGGNEALFKYLVENIKYPNDAKEKGISGTVFIKFIVDKNGKISNVKLIRGVFPSMDEEALRVVAAMPDWKPGKDENGKAVNVEYALPISYKLDEGAKKDAEE